MQKRIEIPQYGQWGVLRADALKFWRDWDGTKSTRDERELAMLVDIAVNPSGLLPVSITKEGYGPSILEPWTLAVLYARAPDFVLAFLAAMRKHWFKNSKRQRIQNFLATHSLIFRERPQDFESIAYYYDKELVDRYNGKHPNETKPATEKDFGSARRELKARFDKGIKLSRKLKLKNHW